MVSIAKKYLHPVLQLSTVSGSIFGADEAVQGVHFICMRRNISGCKETKHVKPLIITAAFKYKLQNHECEEHVRAAINHRCKCIKSDEVIHMSYPLQLERQPVPSQSFKNYKQKNVSHSVHGLPLGTRSHTQCSNVHATRDVPRLSWPRLTYLFR